MQKKSAFTVSAIALLLILGAIPALSQQSYDSTVVQLTGVVWTEENDKLTPLPYVNVFVKNTARGTFTSSEGFFSIVARKGEVVVFSSIGFKSAEYLIPDTLKDNRYTLFQILTKDTVLLPETVIYPWPSREHFKLEFLAMDVHDELKDQAAENLSDKAIAQLLEYLPADGVESTSFYFKQQANSYYYEGQFRPIQILNAFAWQRFIQAWKRGDFKKKKKNN